MSWVDFTAPPPIGTALVLDGQRYELEFTEPHCRKDGAPSFVLTWRTLCPRCGSSFTVTSGLVSKSLNRRCDGCKRTGSPVSRKRGKRVNALVESACSEASPRHKPRSSAS